MAYIKLKNGYLSIMMALMILAPIHRSSAATFTAQDVIDLVNQNRTVNHLAPLKTNKKLTQAAMDKAKDMLANDYFAHVSPSGLTPWHWMDQNGYDYNFAGENLATNFTDAKSQHEAFMKSESHRKNILNEKYEEIGVAVITGKLNGKESIITVQEFGAQMNVTHSTQNVSGASTQRYQTRDASITGNFWSDITNRLTPFQQILVANLTSSRFAIALVLFTSSIIITLMLFAHLLLTANFHLDESTSPPKKRILPNLQMNIDAAKRVVLKILNDFAYMGRIYLNHMKFRK